MPFYLRAEQVSKAFTLKAFTKNMKESETKSENIENIEKIHSSVTV